MADESNVMIQAMKAAARAVVPGYGISELLVESIAKSIEKSKTVAETRDLEQLEKEAALQEVSNQITESQARVAQELAIATRIENAYEVEIEEFYDASGDGNVGVRGGQDKGFNVGVGGSGRKITSRVYRFKGWRDNSAFNSNEINTKAEKK